MHSFIIGNSGAGKSTLALRLVQELQVQHIDLDNFAWAEPAQRREHEEALVLVRAELERAAAVVEGTYASLVADLITVEDRLIWLDLPVEDCVRHCEARPHEPHKWESAAAQDEFLPRLLDFVRGYPTREGELGREAHRVLFEQFSGAKEHVVADFDLDT